MLYFGFFGDNSFIGINDSDLLLSIIAAIVNSIYQISKIKLESNLVGESFVQYCLTCIIARVRWYPFQSTLNNIMLGSINLVDETKLYNDNNKNNDSIGSDSSSLLRIKFYDLMSLPLIDKIGIPQPKIEFDFSHVTVRYVLKFHNFRHW